MRYRELRNIYENNCSVAILNGVSSLALTHRNTLKRFEIILVPFGLELGALTVAFPRFRRRGRLSLAGHTQLGDDTRSRKYLVLRSHAKSNDNRRQYAPPGLSPLEIVQQLNGLDYIVLRWSESIEAGTHTGDIDILVSADSVNSLKSRYSQSVGTFPLDVYTDDGSQGHLFNQVPYYVPSMARRMLDSATISPAGVRTASDKWKYLSFAYHLLFHVKSRRVPPGTNTLSPNIFPHPKYVQELERLAIAASEIPPKTFSDLEDALKRAGTFPGIDLIGFYSNKNRFLKHRYFSRATYKPGLTTFFVRDFGLGLEPVDNIRAALAGHFCIVAEGAISASERERIAHSARGGNWHDPEAPDGRAEPVYWFVCWDQSPRPPSLTTRRKYPRVDNENILVKLRIRTQLGQGSRKPQRLVHASDNTAEAIEHIEHLGLSGHPEVLALKEKLARRSTLL